MQRKRYGGSFAPPLSDDLFAAYRALIDAVEPKTPLRDALEQCFACCLKWWDLPESTGGSRRAHPVGVGVIVDLDPQIKAELGDHIPWSHELKAFAEMFEQIDPVAQRDLRNCAFHLLWHCRELELDREPLTADQLGNGGG